MSINIASYADLLVMIAKLKEENAKLEEELAGWVKSHDEINNRLIAMTEFYEG